MPNGEDITTKYKLDISEFKKNITEANNLMKVSKSEFSKASAGLDDWSKSSDGLNAKLKQLKTSVEAQTSKLKAYQSELQTAQKYEKLSATEVENLKQKLEEAKKTYGENSDEVRNLESQLNKAESAHSSMKKQVADLTVAVNNQEATVTKTEKEFSNYSAKLKEVQSAEEKAKSATSQLSSTIESQQSAVNKAKEAYKEAVIQYGRNSAEARNLAKDVKTLSNDLDENKIRMENADKAADELDKSIKETGNSANEASQGGFTVMKGVLANLATDAIEAGIGALKRLGGAILDVGKQAIAEYSDYEQLVGGVETLFKDSAPIVENYANNAYKTAGLSANGYMETVTSFSASLLQSLNNDTAKTAEYANRAIIDMSDNSNKMGTSIESIQNAYNGFAKQNYTMLDNLKLGYGGTKEEMVRLIKDAAKLKDVQKELGVTVDSNSMSFGNIVNAISVVQKNMDIMGTTSKEASTTIQGSIGSMKSAWTNLLTGMADENADFDTLLSNFINSIGTVAENLFPRIIKVIGTIGGLIKDNLPQIEEQIKTWLSNLMNKIIDGLPQQYQELAKSIKEGLGTAFEMAQNAFKWIIDNGEIVISLLAGIASGFLAFNVGSMIMGVVNAFKAFKLANEGATIAQWLLNAAMSANPIGIVAVAIGALITVIGLLIANWDKVKEIGSKCWDTIKNTWTAAGEWFNSNVVESIKNAFSSIGKDVSIKFTEAKESITDSWNNVSNWFVSNVVEPLKNKFNSLIAFFGDDFEGNVRDVFYELGDSIGGIFGDIVSNIGDIIIGIVTIFQNNFDIIKTIVQTAINVIKAIFSGDFESIRDIVSNAFEVISSKIANTFNNIKGIFTIVVDTMIAVFTPVADWISSNVVEPIKNFFQPLVDWFSIIWNNIKAVIEITINTISTTISTVFNEIQTTTQNVWNIIKITITNIINGIRYTITNVINSIKFTVSSVWNSVKSSTHEAWNNVKSTITNAIESAKNAVSNIVNSIKDIVRNIFNGIKPKLELSLPHVSVDGGEAPWGIAGQGRLPNFRVNWNALGGVIDKPTIFFTAQGLQGAGEAGAEAIVPLERNKYWIKAVANEMKNQLRNDASNINNVNNVSNTTSNVNNFTQIINAPKQPSRLELYRQTRNLLNLKTT